MSDTGKYIVVFKEHVSKDQVQEYARQIDNNGGEVTQHYDILNGFAAKIPDAHLSNLQSLQGNDIIDYIEPDQVVTTQ
ncbi:hypothetical protein FRB99_004637 [Tulasnella sp. 403]|nr:hypothetical protein FRB99_004637 [Tulasnella sp. 403]